MPFNELPAFMSELRENPSISAMALQFLILTASRTGEVLEATWAELDDPDNPKLWTIPEERMKAGREHSIPLSDRAAEIIASMPHCGDYIFPGAREGRPLSNMSMTQLMRGMGITDYRVHGFRSSFRDWAGDCTTVDREVIEHALAHKLPDKVEAAYRRSSALEKRRALMQAWAEFCAANNISDMSAAA